MGEYFMLYIRNYATKIVWDIIIIELNKQNISLGKDIKEIENI